MITGFVLGMFRLVLNVIYGVKIGLVTAIDRYTVKLSSITPTVKSQIVSGLRDVLADKNLDKVTDAATSATVRGNVNSAIETLNQGIGHDSVTKASSLLNTAKTSLESLFIGDHGFLYKLAAINWLHFCIMLFIISIGTMIIVSIFTKKPDPKQLEYTYAATSEEDKALTRSGISRWDIIHTVIILGIVVAFYIYFW